LQVDIVLRGFAPIGIMEQWSDGTMGELVLNEVEGKEFFDNLNGLFSLLPSIFQHSILPCRWHKQVAIKKLVISTSCRNSETYSSVLRPILLGVSIVHGKEVNGKK
jgi:hypothetical protein